MELIILSISRNDLIPMYLQIAKKIKKEILSNTIKAGEKLGSQRELEQQFNVSKITIRKAIQELEKEGLIVTIHGKGSFVKTNKVEDTLDHLQSLSEIIERSGYKPQAKIMKIEMIQVIEELKSEENNQNASYSLYIERLHTIQDKPIAFAQIYLPNEIGERLTKQELENKTVYHLLEHKLGINPGEAIQTIEACPADEKLASYLEVPEGSTLLKAERLTYDTYNQPIEKITFYYRFDEYSFKIRLTRANQITMWPNGG